MTPRVLIIAGSDSGGGAGIQADIKTVTMLGGHAMTAITALTAQNTLGVTAVHPVPTDMVLAQIDAVVRDLGVDAIKIGMIGSARTALAVAERLGELPGVPVVFDPVMVATSGATLADEATVAAFERLMDRATVTTPNLPELEALGRDPQALVAAHGCAVLVKGGHREGPQVVDRLYSADPEDPPQIEWSDPRIETEATHGTGCTLSSAIACGLAQEWDLPAAVTRARRFVRIAMREAPGLGRGHGPMGQQAVRLDLNLSFFEPMLNQVTVPAQDLAASERFYRLLGLRQVVRAAPRYARFETEGGATFSIATDAGYTAPVAYFECGDLDVTVAYLQQQGVKFDQEPKDESWGWREARLRDPAGNAIRLYQAGEMRRFRHGGSTMTKLPGPDLKFERKYKRLHKGPVAGVDEAGRGPLAGPVVAAAVVLDPRCIPEGINDSKVLTAARRERLCAELLACARVGVGIASVEEIDTLNIFWATMLAMSRAVEALGFLPAFVLVDGNRCPDWSHQSHAVVGGDALCLSIAAASIVAKHKRDCMMEELDALHPEYGWRSNKGYAARVHQEALRTLGPTPHHRRSFGPVAQAELDFGPLVQAAE